ncbi:MAG TPA: hypothetical protein VGC13_03005 [Longimicrobium sp.]|jgi:hypothetical protein|uniref:hypothetical protein n=1 Tax=Longimicrobium sp. TaxID=2029185 RepID=UPI002ED7993C
MRSMPLLRLGSAIWAVLTLAACQGSTEPLEPLSPVYELTLVEGSPDRVIAEVTYPSGTHQIYTMVYDSLSFISEVEGRRSFLAVVETLGADGRPLTPPVLAGFAHTARVTRRRNRVIMAYRTNRPTSPDTFTITRGNLVKQGPHGVTCDTCAPVRRVEYVYEPRDTTGTSD